MPRFKNLILLGRPASGKSEFIDFIKKTPDTLRASEFHIGPFCELDDFLWLWDKFVEDDLWEAAGHKRLCSKRAEHGYLVTDGSILDYCLARFNTEFQKQPKDNTVFVEFSRGTPDGGYRHALDRLSDELLQDAAVLFIYTTYEEAIRRNEARYQAKLKHSVLAHKVPEEDMIRFAKEIDWLELTKEQPSGYLTVRNQKIPFVTMNNEPEYKVDQVGPLTERYGSALKTLMNLYQKK